MTGTPEPTAPDAQTQPGAQPAGDGDILSGAAGDGQPPSPAPAAPAAPNPTPPKPDQGPDTAWLSTLDDGTRQWATDQGIKTPADLAKAHQDLMGKALVVPGEDTTDEERDAFYQRLGRPEKPEGYEFQKPEDVPSYNDGFADWFRGSAHAAGLSAAQAGALHDQFVAFAKQQAQDAAADRAEAQTQGKAALKQQWGSKYGANLDLANRVVASTPGLKERLAEFDLTNVPELAAILAEHGRATLGEDTLVTGDSPGSADLEQEKQTLRALKEKKDWAGFAAGGGQARLDEIYVLQNPGTSDVPAGFRR